MSTQRALEWGKLLLALVVLVLSWLAIAAKQHHDVELQGERLDDIEPRLREVETALTRHSVHIPAMAESIKDVQVEQREQRKLLGHISDQIKQLR